MVRLSTHDYAKEGAAVLLNAYKVEEDYFQRDFNEKMYEKETTIARTLKLSTLGGAIAAFISVDVNFGYVHAHFVKNFADPMDRVRRTVETYKQENKSIKLFAADDNGLSHSEKTVMIIKDRNFGRSARVYENNRILWR